MVDGGAETDANANPADEKNELKVHTLLKDQDADKGGKLGTGIKQGHGDPGRVPVAVLARPPVRPAATGRRPVVALLDTGVDSGHPWLAGTPDDPVVRDAAELGWTPGKSSVDTEMVLFSPSREYHGHATFVAGVVLQIAPAGRLLSARVMDSTGLVPREASRSALSWLSRLARDEDPSTFPDIVCLTYGYQPDPSDDEHKDELRAVLRELADQGVLIVASAGNDGADTPTFPAAFAADPPPWTTPVISVGALNPDETYSHYSNYGDWVTHRAIGTGVISIIERFDDDQLPLRVNGYDHGCAVDPDDFRAGFARWAGTSFAAAHIAGLLARALSTDPTLADVSRTATVKRAAVARAAIGGYRTRT